LLSLPGVLLLLPGGYLLANGNPELGGVLLAGAIILLLLASLVSSAVNSILLAAIYLYATEGEVPDYFDRDLIEHSFAGT
jgi:hypothetical protein